MYAELHCHSAFSLLDGASHPEALIERAVHLGLSALALTDHDDLGGAVVFAQSAYNAGVNGIIGVELTIEIRDSRFEIGGDSSRISNLESRISAFTHLTLLAESRQGYGNLSSLVTRARMGHPRGRPRVSLETLARHSAGIFALTGCPRGWVPQLLASGDHDAACDALSILLDIFERRVAVECWDHGLPEERELVRQLIPLARAFDIPWAVTNDVHYAHPTGRVVHDVLCCLRHAKTLDQMGTRLRPNGEWYLKGAEQMRLRWQGHEEGLRTTLAIAERCAFRLEQLKPTLPAFPLPPGVTPDEYLERLVVQGAKERWGLEERDSRFEIRDSGADPTGADRRGVDPTSSESAVPDLESRISNLDFHRRQLHHELSIIRRLNLAGFFLIVWDIVRFAKREGILCQGRGSAANSAVCFCLGITAVDPIKLELLFERFLSEERQEAPDIDIDFAHQDREKVIQYVYERYGREHAAMVCEQITYRGRSAVRDSARVLGFSVEQANLLAALSDRFSARATAQAMRGEDAERDDLLDGVGAPNLHEMIGSHLVPGTEANTRARQADEDERIAHRRRVEASRAGRPESIDERAAKIVEWKISRADEMDRARKERPLTSSDRPRPKASYEPYGSPSAQDSGSAREYWEDPHAEQTHNERRNPTTAFRSSEDRASLLTQAGLDPQDPRVRALPQIVDGLHQIPRHRSIHVGGFILTEEPLSTVVPIEPAAMPDRTVIQWEKDDTEAMGLVKIDLLGLGMLTLLQECIKYIRQTRGVTIDLAQLDFRDQAVYDDLCRADTIGIFQVESRAQMNTLPRLKPRCFYDLVVEVAIIRPGPIQGDMVHPYLRRRAGEEPVTYPHPSVESILKRTLGVPLFQEQGMQVAIAAAGFTPGEADNLRRAMGHKRSRERMAEICERLIIGMQKNGIPEETARKIYNQINAFADYGFPESHAASFALLVYASAYLKHYYAPEFTAAILNAQPMGFYSAGTLIEDARRHGVKVLPVDCSRSLYDTTLEARDSRFEIRDSATCLTSSKSANESRNSNLESRATPPAVRLGLRLVRGIGSKAREKLKAALDAGGSFLSIADVVHRSGLDRGSLRALAESGAFDSFVPDEPDARRRRAAIWRMLEEFRGDAGPLAPRPASLEVPPSVTPMSPVEITAADYRMTGVSLNGHPMKHLRKLLLPNGIRTAREVLGMRDGERNVAVAGLVICRQRPGTAKGFVFLTLEDETGLVNVVVTPKRFERQALMISTAPMLLVRGTLQVEQTVVNLRGEVFRELKAKAGEEWAKGHDFH
ncbi:MAG TPA: PHP domain-containing protein [Gemmatimonadaceae bacterium]|nr:PHP domain-containing protein [Gemmatimonadaceae bacterium]